jgi:DNA topoisomerase-1
LIIVESPAKARTIQNFVDAQANIVDFSAGHIRDLPVTADASPDLNNQMVCPQIRLKASALGIDVQNGFKAHYVNMPGKQEVIRRLQRLSKKASRIILATDEDREGEAISWHLTEVLQPTVPYKVNHASFCAFSTLSALLGGFLVRLVVPSCSNLRILSISFLQRAVFHEITKDAILKAFEHPRDIDMNLVHSQETRRVLDRLAGFTVSPILWRYVAPGLSAGRVQSCGLHSITEVRAHNL